MADAVATGPPGPGNPAGSAEASEPAEPVDPSLPWPGEELVSRVASGTDRAAFHASGRQSVRDLQAVLATVGRELADYGDILDFGCGCGRILLWLRDLAATSRLYGSDVDERAIRWARENLPWATFSVNTMAPPLDHPDRSFDLIYNHSVFTHLDRDNQDRWLAELWRVARPGAHLIVSVHGERPLALFEQASRDAGGDPDYLRRRRDAEGLAFIQHDAFTGGPHDEGYHSTFHAPWYVFEHWSRYFEVLAYVPNRSLGYQDFVLLQRRPGDESVPLPEDDVVVRRRGQHPGGTPPPERRPPHDVAHLLARPLHGPSVDAPARFGRASHAARRAALRFIDNYARYQHEVDTDLIAAVRALDGAMDDLTRRIADLSAELDELRYTIRVEGVLTLEESNCRLWDVMSRQGERINRLEADLWAAIDAARPGTDRR